MPLEHIIDFKNYKTEQIKEVKTIELRNKFLM